MTNYKNKKIEKNTSNYKSQKIWVISDVDNQVKDKAKELAKLDKKKIGAWLTDLILKRNSQSTLHITDQIDNSKDIKKILENITFEICELHIKLDNLSSKFSSLENKTFFNKFFK